MSKREVTITLDEWQAELDRQRQDHPPDDPGETTAEIAKRIGKGIDATRVIVRKAVEAGRAIVGKRWVKDSAGRVQPVPVYRIKRA